MEVGAFYPFSRNHNSLRSSSQEPYTWASVASISRKVLGIRYSLIPYYYTLFYEAHVLSHDVPSATVWRPLFFEFPSDVMTYNISKQFMVGKGIMISPVLDQGTSLIWEYILYIVYNLTLIHMHLYNYIVCVHVYTINTLHVPIISIMY